MNTGHVFFRAARRRPQLWRVVAGCVLILACGVAGVGAVLGGLWLWGGAAYALGVARTLESGATPAAALMLLATFVGLALGPVLAVRLLHARSGASLFGRREIVLRHFVLAAGVVFAIYGIGIALWLIWFTPEPNLAPSRWLSLLPLALIGVAVQTGAEEMVFRGYLMQQLAARFRNPAIWLILPALVFGAVHYNPATVGANVWILVAAAALFGLIAGDLTARTGSIGAAWGFHFANNVVAIVVISTKGSITGLALVLTPYGVDDGAVIRALIFGDIAMLLLAWLALRRVLG